MRYQLELGEASHSRYWLIDAASLPPHEALRRYYEGVESPCFRWLYEATPYRAAQEAGPLLLDITGAGDFFRHYRAEWLHHAAALVIDTPLPIDALQDHLAAAVRVGLPGEGQGLLRFHEPMLLHLLLGEGLLPTAQRDALVGSGNRWAWALCRHSTGTLYETYRVAADDDPRPAPALSLDRATLTQLTAIERLSRLMPLLGTALERFDRLTAPSEISCLWLSLADYWRAQRERGTPQKQAVATAQQMLAQAGDWAALLERLEASASSLASRT